MPMHPPGDEERRLIKLLHALVRQKMSLEEAAALFGLPNEKALKNRFYLDARLTFTEMLKFADKLGIDRQELFAGVRILPPSLLNLPAVLRYFAGRDEVEDEELRRYLADPPGPVLGEGEAIGVPQRFLELEDRRARDPRRVPRELDRWLRETHAKAVFDPTPAKVIEYCSALDSKATELAFRGHHREAAVVLAHALELSPVSSVVSIYHRENAARVLRRLARPRIALMYAKIAQADASLYEDRSLEARCLLTSGAIHIALDDPDSMRLAERCYRGALDLAPGSYYALSAMVSRAYIAIESDRPEKAFEILTTMEPGLDSYSVLLGFYRRWIQGRAQAKMGNDELASDYFLEALALEPESQDPGNLLLVFDCLLRLPSCSVESINKACGIISPQLRRLNTRSATLRGIAARVIGDLENYRATSNQLAALLNFLRSSEFTGS